MSLPTPDVTLMGLIVTLVEFVKIYLPDNIEPKAVPFISVMVGVILGQFANMGGWMVGLVSALSASGLYSVASNMVSKVGSNTK
jgi:hypothetical protein